MTPNELIQTLEFNLYCLRAYNISAREREEAIRDTMQAIESLKESLCKKK